MTRIGSKKEVDDLVEMLERVDGIVVHDPSAKILLSGGGVSDLYINIKKALGNAIIRRDLAKIMVRHLAPDITFIAAAGYGGLPLGVEISSLAGLPLSMIRDREKGHGLGGLVDGFAPKGDDVGIIVDDVLTTGGSLLRSRRALGGADVSSCMVVMDRGHPVLDFDVSYILRVEDIKQNSE